MVYKFTNLARVACFAICLSCFTTPARAQDEMSPSEPLASAAEQAVVYCVLPDYGAQRIFYAPLRTLPSVTGSELSRLSLRFVRSVNAQQQAGFDLNRRACGRSPTIRAASGELRRAMSPLLGMGYMAVEIGIF